jgi:hypothetical protein
MRELGYDGSEQMMLRSDENPIWSLDLPAIAETETGSKVDCQKWGSLRPTSRRYKSPKSSAKLRHRLDALVYIQLTDDAASLAELKPFSATADDTGAVVEVWTGAPTV